jgi:hypothetical protein
MGITKGPRVPGELLVDIIHYWHCYKHILYQILDGPDGNPIVSVEYELFGTVQGCFFQKYAKEVAEQLQIGGWIKNTKKGTIVGKLQGPKNSLQQM